MTDSSPPDRRSAPADEVPAAIREDLRRQSRRRLRVVLVCLVLGLILPEVIIRWVLFSPTVWAREMGADIRRAHYFADPDLEEAYWHLRWTLDDSPAKHQGPSHDQRLGWVNSRFDPESREHLAQDELPGRRPVLMYGASFVDCMTKRRHCFERLMRNSELGPEHCLRNYGVGGYGIDQVLLLMQDSIDHYAEDDPVVVFGIVLDSDLERSVLGFRAWPKPRLRLTGGDLVGPEPVFDGGSGAYVAEEGIGITSYAWRYLLHHDRMTNQEGWKDLLRGTEAKRAEQDDLIDAILFAMRDECESRGLDYFFLFFTSPRSLPPHEVPPQEERLTRLFLEEGVPFVHVRPYIMRAAEAYEEGLDALFIPAGPAQHHPNAEGNRVIFEALRDGIEGRFTTQVELP